MFLNSVLNQQVPVDYKGYWILYQADVYENRQTRKPL